MLAALQDFFWMGGYGAYVWPAYGIGFVVLMLQWYFPWRRWKKYLKHQQK